MALTISQTVAAPVERVFAAFTDLPRTAEVVEGIESVEVLTDGPFAVGTRWRETRVIFNKQATEEMEVTAVEPNRSYTVRAESCGAEYVSQFRFTPDGDQTRVELELRSRPLSLWAWLFWPLGFLMRGMMRKCLEKDMEDMKKDLEATA